MVVFRSVLGHSPVVAAVRVLRVVPGGVRHTEKGRVYDADRHRKGAGGPRASWDWRVVDKALPRAAGRGWRGAGARRAFFPQGRRLGRPRTKSAETPPQTLLKHAV